MSTGHHFQGEPVAVMAAIPAEPVVQGGDRRRVSVTRDLHDPVAITPALSVPDGLSPEGPGSREPLSCLWQERIRLSMTDEGHATPRWPGVPALSHVRQILAKPSSWRQVTEQLVWRGIAPGELLPALAVADARGWVTIANETPDEPLDLAAFLSDMGLLSVDQVTTLISESQAFRECRFDAFCKELISRKMLSLAKTGFVNRLGRLLSWHVVPTAIHVGSSQWVQDG